MLCFIHNLFNPSRHYIGEFIIIININNVTQISRWTYDTKYARKRNGDGDQNSTELEILHDVKFTNCI